MRRLALSILAATAAPALASGYPNAELQQRACYTVDRDRIRTASLVQEGTGDVTIAALTSLDGKPAYDVEVRFKLRLSFVGWQAGKVTLTVPQDYFHDAFLSTLARSTPQTSFSRDYKMEFMTLTDARTLDGQTFEDAVFLRFWDVDTSRSETLLTQATTSPFTDLTLKGAVAKGVPGIGAVKIDVKGKMQGVQFKVGMDFTANASACLD